MAEEEGFIRMYVRDFAQMASRAETGLDVEEALLRRVAEARSHALVMDSRKSGDHLGALTERVRQESERVLLRPVAEGHDPEAARARRTAFLTRVSGLLQESPVAKIAEAADAAAG